MEFSRQEYWSGLQCPSSGDLPDTGSEPRSAALKGDSLPFKLPGKPQKTQTIKENLDSTFKSRDITLPTKVHLVKALAFPVVMYACESWTIKKAES